MSYFTVVSLFSSLDSMQHVILSECIMLVGQNSSLCCILGRYVVLETNLFIAYRYSVSVLLFIGFYSTCTNAWCYVNMFVACKYYFTTTSSRNTRILPYFTALYSVHTRYAQYIQYCIVSRRKHACNM